MFFLGASAHILIYLLFPAFLIVCLYFNGKIAIPETGELSAIYIIHQPKVAEVNLRDTYLYHTTEQKCKEKKSEKKIYSPVLSIQYPEITIVCHSINIEGKSLRAPPALILGC